MKLKEARRIVQARARVGSEYVAIDQALNAGMAWADEIISCAGTGVGAAPALVDLEAGRDIYPAGYFGRLVGIERKCATTGGWDPMNYAPFAAFSYCPPGYWWTILGDAVHIKPLPAYNTAGGMRLWGYPVHIVDPKGDADSRVLFPPHSESAVMWYATLEVAESPAIIKRAERSLARAELTFRKYAEIPQAGVAAGMLKERP